MEVTNLEIGEIYIVKNKIDNKIYIGQVRSFRPSGKKRGTRERWYEHVRSALKNENKCVLLERAIRETGQNNFSVDVICVGKLEELDDLERKYIKEYRSTEREFGYNMTKGGKASISETSREMLSIKVKEQWKDPKFREKISKSVKNASIERWKIPETRERMRKAISNAIKNKGDSEGLPEYVYLVKKDGYPTGYRACVNRLKLNKLYCSRKLSMKEKYELAFQQVQLWRTELGV